MITIITIIVILITCSCNQKEDFADVKTINLLSQSDSIIKNLSFLASDIRYIHLKTPQNISFSYIYKIVSCQDNLYVNSGQDLLCFDNSGHFLYCLPQNAKDSLEFIWDFDISSDQRTIVILNYGRILFFDNAVNKFDFLKSIKLNNPSPSKISFVPETDKILLSIFPRRGTEKSLSILINRDGDTLYSKRNQNYFKLPVISEKSIIQFRTENNLCFKEQFSDTVFCVDNKFDSITPWLILDTKGKSVLNFVKGEGEYAYDKTSPYATIENIFEVSGFFIYKYSYHYPKLEYAFHYPKPHYTVDHKIIYNKTTGKKYEINIDNDLKNDLSGGPDFFPVCVSGGKLYSWTYGSDLKKYTDSVSFSKIEVQNHAQKENLKKLSDSLKNTDIILIVATPN